MTRRTRAEWRSLVLRTRLLTSAQRVLLLELAQEMDARLYVCVLRSDLAARLNVTDDSIKKRLKEARSCGFLDLVSAGNRSGPSVYIGTFPS